MTDPRVIVITGIMASGKSTIAQAVAERLPQSVHLRGDLFRRMIVNGELDLSPGLSDQAFAQLLLRYRLAALAANTYCAAGYTVVYQDVIIGDVLRDVIAMLEHPAHLIVLCPSPDVVAAREAGRGKVGYGDWTPARLDHELRAHTPRLGLWLDTSALSVEATVEAILACLADSTLRSA